MLNTIAKNFWKTRYEQKADLGSGVGSKGVWKQKKLDLLTQLIERHQVKSILDLGCGDMQVIRDLPDFERFRYTGIDFSATAIERNREQFPDKTFIQSDLHDIYQQKLPQHDLVICFDVLFHIQDDTTHDLLCEFLFNCGARSLALTYAVGLNETNNQQMWYRDFYKATRHIPKAYINKWEAPFRLSCERLAAFEFTTPEQSRPVTEVAYLVTPDRLSQLQLSLKTLFASGSTFDRVTILLRADNPPEINCSDTRVCIKLIDPFFEGYQYGNKVKIAELSSERVIFLDADTFVLRPLDLLWQNSNTDFLARIGKVYQNNQWDKLAWKKAQESVGATDVPMFNSGVLVFQNRSHQKIGDDWRNIVKQYREDSWPQPWQDWRMPDQWGLSLAVGKNRLTYQLLEPYQHAFGFANESFNNAVVFHTGNDSYQKLSEQIKYTWHIDSTTLPNLKWSRSPSERIEKYAKRVARTLLKKTKHFTSK